MFPGLCTFKGECLTDGDGDAITTHEELLRRVIWNLVLNSYTAHVNNEIPELKRCVTIRVDSAKNSSLKIEVKDNAGGMDNKTRRFFQRSFSSITKAFKMEADLIHVVETMEKEENAINRVGLFFAAVAVNDMGGCISVASKGDDGTAITIQLPREIERLKGLLEF